MRLVDVGLLLHAHDASSPGHAAARSWLETTLREGHPVGVAWVSVLAFLRIATNGRLLGNPMSAENALRAMRQLLAHGSVRLVEPGPQFWPILQRLIEDHSLEGAVVMDAALAALALEQDAVLCTTDPDFARFRGLQVLYPLDPDQPGVPSLDR